MPPPVGLDGGGDDPQLAQAPTASRSPRARSCVEIETDKATMTYESPAAGVLDDRGRRGRDARRRRGDRARTGRYAAGGRTSPTRPSRWPRRAEADEPVRAHGAEPAAATPAPSDGEPPAPARRPRALRRRSRRWLAGWPARTASTWQRWPAAARAGGSRAPTCRGRGHRRAAPRRAARPPPRAPAPARPRPRAAAARTPARRRRRDGRVELTRTAAA